MNLVDRGVFGMSPKQSVSLMFPVTITGPVIATPRAMPNTWLSLHEAVSAFKRGFILDVLSHFGGNRSRTAAALGIERTSLLRLIRDLSIAPVPRPQRDEPAASMGDHERTKVCPRCHVDLLRSREGFVTTTGVNERDEL